MILFLASLILLIEQILLSTRNVIRFGCKTSLDVVNDTFVKLSKKLFNSSLRLNLSCDDIF